MDYAKSVALLVVLAVLFLITRPLPAQHEQMEGMYGPYPAAREASGSSWQPDSTPHEGIHLMREDKAIMTHGFLNVIYDKQNGKRGGEKAFSESMFMLTAQKPVENGKLGFRAMLSLDPVMGKKGYPLLLQTGETADGATPLIDRQHPHDFFMELAGVYSASLSQDCAAFAYFGLPGEPALGPPTFMHRFSGADSPGAPITHHWLDSTHITFGVLTSGLVWKNIKIEGSLFRGREPNQNRWDIESPKLDSASGRISFNPAQNWAMQASYGYIDSPEQLEPDVDTRRTTASVIYNKAFQNANCQATFAWGRNDNLPGKALDGFLLEFALRIRDTHTFFKRFERAEKDELFSEDEPLHGQKFTVNKITIGYIYDLPSRNHIGWGIGSSFDVSIIPDSLKRHYGSTPLGVMIFVRLKLK